MRNPDHGRPVPQLSAPPPDSPLTLESPVLTDGVRTYRDVVFANEIGYRPLRMDIMVPVRDEPAPVTLWLHGGGFLMGSRRRSDLSGPPWDALLAGGIAVAAVEYRFAFEALFPACVHDVKAAVRWLRKYGADLGLRPDAIGCWGESAGGYLSAFLALDGQERAVEGSVGVTDVPAEVAAAVSWYGPTDFLRMDEHAEGQESVHPHNAPGSPESLLIGGALPEHPAAANAASPLSYANGSAVAPLLLLHGALDPYVPHQQSVELAKALAARGADVTLNIVPGAGHMFAGVDHAPLIGQSVDFLLAHFR